MTMRMGKEAEPAKKIPWCDWYGDYIENRSKDEMCIGGCNVMEECQNCICRRCCDIDGEYAVIPRTEGGRQKIFRDAKAAIAYANNIKENTFIVPYGAEVTEEEAIESTTKIIGDRQ